MALTRAEEAKFISEQLETRGVFWVRKLLGQAGSGWNNDEIAVAEEWLQTKEHAAAVKLAREADRPNAIRSWISIGISVVALIVAVYAATQH